MRDTLSIDELKDRLLDQLDEVLGRFYDQTGAYVKGNRRFLLNSPRGDRNIGSFCVTISGPDRGRWADFAMAPLRGGKAPYATGDVFDLLAMGAHTANPADTFRLAREIVGLQTEDPAAARAREDRRKAREAEAAAERRRKEEKRKKRQQIAEGIWLSAQAAIEGTPVDAYLSGRGIDLRALPHRPNAIRYHPACRYYFEAEDTDPETGEVRRVTRWRPMPAIVTRGWDDREPSMAIGGRALANQRAEHRVLHFKSGAAWLDYNKAFGTSDPFSAMMGGLHGLARDVAMLRVLGPNPRMGLTYAGQVAQKLAADTGNDVLAERATRAVKKAKAMMAHQDGSANIPHHVGWARFFSGVRSTLTSIQLGSAAISSVTDAATITAAAHTIGMSATNVLSRSVKLMASQADRASAARMGYVAETLADAGGTMARYFGKNFGTGLPERLATFTLRATGLSFITDMRKIAFQMEFAGHLAGMADKGWAEIEAPVRTMLSRRGITAADWDLMRAPETRFYPEAEGQGGNGGPAMDGPSFLTPYHWLEHQTTLPRVEAEGLAMRWQMAIQEQLEMAIPSASLEGRAWMQGETAPGSFLGELARSSSSYKSFTFSLMLNQYRRFAEADSWGMNRWSYAAKLSTMLILTGALAIQLKELAKGNDPRPMDTLKFWIAANFQGGGLGIFGDFFQSETSRVGGGIGETLAGPVAGFAGDVLGPIASNLTAAVNGEKTYWGRDAANIVRQNTPFLSSAWYLRTAYSRLVSDNLQSFLDPEAELIFRRRIKKLMKDYGTSPFWPQGRMLPTRLPNLSNAFGAGQ